MSYPRKSQRNKGFTLIEMMVSVSLFVIVALIVSGVLIQLSTAYKKAQAMRLLMDNLNFALEKMNLEIREGVKIDNPGSEESSIKYHELGDTETTYCYSLLEYNDRQTLVKCQSGCPCTDSSEAIKDMLSSEISLDHLSFKVFAVSNGSNRLTKALISIKGKVTSRFDQMTEFMIQTSASQRTPDS